jgi:arylsulfatase A
MSIDFLPTFCRMAGKPIPAGITLDGRDITDVLTHGAPSPHDQLVLFDDEDVVGIRTQRWKYVDSDYYRTFRVPLEGREYPQLYDMQADSTESYSAASLHPEILADMRARFQQAKKAFEPLKSKELPAVFRTGKPKRNQD